MRPPNMNLEYRLTVHRPDGSTRTETDGTAESFVVQYLQILRAGLASRKVGGVINTVGTAQSIRNPNGFQGQFLDVDAKGGDKGSGPVIGSGTAGVTVSDFDLDSQLTGSIAHGSTDVQGVQTSPPDATLAVQRDFTNNSGSSVTANEVGIIATTATASSGAQQFLIVRDTVPSTVIQDNETASLEYIVSITA
jgi:hypothetical protein